MVVEKQKVKDTVIIGTMVNVNLAKRNVDTGKKSHLNAGLEKDVTAVNVCIIIIMEVKEEIYTQE